MGKSIAVAGKGGTGKTTLAALLVLALKEMGESPILVVDADPDSNLGALLGVEVEKSIGELREDILRDIKNFPAGMSKASYVEAGLHQIIEEAEGFDLVTMGRGEGAGCYCYLNNLIRKFSDDLAPSYDWVVIDNEAGLEHLSRRTTQDVDDLLIVVNANPMSLNSAKRIKDITQNLDSRIKHKYVVTSMVQPENLPLVRERVDEMELELLCSLPFDDSLQRLILEGKPLKLEDGTAVREAIESIMNRIGGENGNS